MTVSNDDLVVRPNRRDILQLIVNNQFDPHPAARLYAALLAKTLCQADPILMEEFGKELAEMTDH